MEKRIGIFVHKLSQLWIKVWRSWKKVENPSNETDQDVEPDNPYVDQIRDILGEVLKTRGLSYGRMQLVVIDGETDSYCIGEEQILTALNLLGEDLNSLCICTERPDFFQEYGERMYQEHGLLVTFLPKKDMVVPENGVVLDFEKQGKLYRELLREGILYLPIYKKRWQKAQNLDILVPIGYNTVTVKIQK